MFCAVSMCFLVLSLSDLLSIDMAQALIWWDFFTCFLTSNPDVLDPFLSASRGIRVSLQSLQNRDSQTAENEKTEFTQAHKYERRNKVTSSLARHTFVSDYMTLLASNFPWIRKTINPITPRENWRAGLGGNLLRSYDVLREREREAKFCGAGYISTHSNSFMASEQKEQSLCGL